MLAGFLYSAGPFPISHTPFGEWFAGGFLGCILFNITWFSLTKTVTAESVLYSLPLVCMIAGILELKVLLKLFD